MQYDNDVSTDIHICLFVFCLRIYVTFCDGLSTEGNYGWELRTIIWLVFNEGLSVCKPVHDITNALLNANITAGSETGSEGYG